MANGITEGDILKQVRDYLRWRGWLVIRNHQSLGSHRGLSDLVALKNGEVLWIEIKRPGGKLSRHQEKFKEDVEAHGGNYLVITDLAKLIHSPGF